MQLTFNITENTDLMTKRLEALDYLRTHEIEIGLLPSAPAQTHYILAIQEHGAPITGIPSRPVVGPALDSADTKSALSAEFEKAVSYAHEGDLPSAIASLEAAGQAGADGIRAYIDSGISPPNSPMTVSGGWMRNRVSGKPVHIAGKGFNKPLYDTGALYAAFSYEIRPR